MGFAALSPTGDLRYDGSGAIDRPATARALAARAYLGFDTLSPAAQADLVAYVQGQLPASDAAVVAGAAITLHGFLQVSDLTATTTSLTTDYGVESIGGRQEPLGLMARHTVRAGDTLQAIAAAYYGSAGYWYLIAEANGLSGSEPLTAGTSLTVPNRVTNSFNAFDSYRVYNQTDLIGNTVPGTRFKPGAFQRGEQIIGVIVMIVVTIIVAIFAPEIIGTVWSIFEGLIGSLAATVLGFAAAGAVGYTAGYAASVATQTGAVDAGLQQKVDYQQARKAGANLAVTALAAGLMSWAKTAYADVSATADQALFDAADDYSGTAGQSLDKAVEAMKAENAAGQIYQVQRVAIEAGKQLLQNHGRITNVSGLVEAAFGLNMGQGTLQSTTFAGLSLAERASRNKHQLTGLDWFDFAASAATAIVTSGSGNGAGTPAANARAGAFDWRNIATSALFTGVRTFVAARTGGEDAAIEAFGTGVGQFLGNAAVGQPTGNALVGALWEKAGRGVEALRSMDDAPTSPVQPSSASDINGDWMPDEAYDDPWGPEHYLSTHRYGSTDGAKVRDPIQVRPGQTMSGITGSTDVVYLNKLAYINGLKSPHDLRAGRDAITMFTPEELVGVVLPEGYVQNSAARGREISAVVAARAEAARAAVEQANAAAASIGAGSVAAPLTLDQAQAKLDELRLRDPIQHALVTGTSAGSQPGYFGRVYDALTGSSVIPEVSPTLGERVQAAGDAIYYGDPNSSLDGVEGLVSTTKGFASQTVSGVKDFLAHPIDNTVAGIKSSVSFIGDQWLEISGLGMLSPESQSRNAQRLSATTQVWNEYNRALASGDAERAAEIATGPAWMVFGGVAGVTRGVGGVANSARTFPEGLAYRIDLPDHLIGPDGFTKAGQLSGTHNLQNATAALEARGANYTLSPTGTNGISELHYTYTNPATGKLVSGYKTVYDPLVYSNETMLYYSMKAGQLGWERYLQNPTQRVFDVTHENINFRTYINTDRYGNPYVGSVFPIK